MPRFSSVRFSRPSTHHQLHVSTLDVICFNLQLYPTVLKFAGIFFMSIQSEHLFIQVDIHVCMSWVAMYELAWFLLGSFLLLRNKEMKLFNPCLPSVTGNVPLTYLLFIANRSLFLFLGKLQVENCFVFNFHVVISYVSLFFMVCGFDVRLSLPLPSLRITKILF